MKRYTKMLLAGLPLFFTANIIAQPKDDQQAMMKAMAAYMTPSDMHKEMAKYDGDYTATVTLWMDPKQAPMTTTGTCTYKMVMGGRYQEGTFTSTMMGQPMEGKSIMGYDNAKKIFQNTWIDNMGTGITMLSGPWDETSSSINLTGIQTDPVSGKDMKVRETMHVDDPTHLTMTMYMTPEGAPEVKSMEVKFTKKK